MELRVSIFQRRVGRNVHWHTLGLGRLDRTEAGPSQSKVQQRLIDGLRKAVGKLWPSDLELLEPARGRKIEVVRLEMNLSSEAGRQSFFGKVPLVVEPRGTGPAGGDPVTVVYHPLRTFEWFLHEPGRVLADEAQLFFRERWAALDDDELERLKSDPRDSLRLIAFSTSPHALEDKLLQDTKMPPPSLMGGGPTETGNELLQKLGTNQTLRAIDGRLRLGMTRSPYREQLQQLVCGRQKNSVLLVGPSGVGKSTLLAQLVHDLVEADDFASHRNLDKTHAVWKIRGRRIIAGMMYLGQWEQRCVELVSACKRHRGVLWIEDLDAWGRIGETRESDRSLSTFFRGPIARKELIVVAECTAEGYQRLQDDAPGLAASLSTVFIAPTDHAQTTRMLVHEARKLEREHDVAFDPMAFQTIYELGAALSAGSVQPGKSIDLLRRLTGDWTDAVPDLREAEAEAAAGRKISAIKAFRAKTGAGLRDSKDAVEAFMERGHWPVVLPKPAPVQRGAVRSLLDDQFVGSAGPGDVGPASVVNHLARETGMPEVLLSPEAPLQLDTVQRALAGQIMGQQPAVAAMCDLVIRLKAGLNDPTRPYGVFLFTGPTGTGKTEMAKCLAEYLYGDVGRLLRFDMSEYGGYDAPARLIGDRYQPEGTLTSKVRAQPFSVVLLDEIEKAAGPVLNLMLQLFDDGRLTDATGTVIDFTHTVVIMTSNLGAKKSPSVGFDESADETAKDVQAAVREFFPPELFNRIERVVQFAPLSLASAHDIARRELTGLLQRRGLTERNVFVRFTDAVVDDVVARGFNRRDGARSLKRYLEDRIGGFLGNEISSRVGASVRLLWLFMRDEVLCVHHEELGDAAALGASSPLESLLHEDAQSVRARIPELRRVATGLLTSDALEQLNHTLSEEVERYAERSSNADEGEGPEGNILELEQLRSELAELVKTLEVQSAYDPSIAGMREPDDAIEYESELLEADSFGTERMVAHRHEVYVRTLDIRQLQPALPLRNRADLLGAVGDVMFLEQMLGRAAEPDEHCVTLELTRITRTGGASRFARAKPGLLEWLTLAYLEGRGQRDALLLVDEAGAARETVGVHALMSFSWSRAILRVVGPGVRTFFAAEHGTHIRDSRTSGTEMVRVRVCPGDEHPAEHLSRIESERERFVYALERAPKGESLPAHPDAILPTVRRYRFDPLRPGELTEILVEDYPLMFSMSTYVRRLADVLPALWLLRLGASADGATAKNPVGAAEEAGA